MNSDFYEKRKPSSHNSGENTVAENL